MSPQNRISDILERIPGIIHSMSLAILAHDMAPTMGSFGAMVFVLAYIIKR
jgi:hypothetical protein